MSDTIFGLDTSADDAARLMNLYVRKDWIEMEPLLYNGKWFDYRFMNPVQATYLYAHEYVRFYRQAYGKNYDSTRAEFITPLRPETLFTLPEMQQGLDEKATKAHDAAVKKKKVVISGIWRGRMFADAMGMPYEQYLEFAFHWTMRFWKQDYLPRPSQLYTDLVTDRAATAWEERSGAMLFFSKMPQYKNAVYEKLNAMMQGPAFEGKALNSHNAHHEWLFQQIANRHDDAELTARLIWEFQVLPADKVRERIGDSAFELVTLKGQSIPNHHCYN